MPVAGADVGAALVQLLGDRGIEFNPEQIVMKVDPAARIARFEFEDTSYDLLIGIPPHRVPQVLRAAKLADASGWVPVDPGTLQTRHPHVFAIGNVTSIRLPVGMFLPKAGVFADEEARVVAENIAAEIAGKVGTSRFNGHGFCYIEVATTWPLMAPAIFTAFRPRRSPWSRRLLAIARRSTNSNAPHNRSGYDDRWRSALPMRARPLMLPRCWEDWP